MAGGEHVIEREAELAGRRGWRQRLQGAEVGGGAEGVAVRGRRRRGGLSPHLRIVEWLPRCLAPLLLSPRHLLRSLNPSPAMSPAAAHLATVEDPDEDPCASTAEPVAEEVAPAPPCRRPQPT